MRDDCSRVSHTGGCALLIDYCHLVLPEVVGVWITGSVAGCMQLDSVLLSTSCRFEHKGRTPFAHSAMPVACLNCVKDASASVPDPLSVRYRPDTDEFAGRSAASVILMLVRVASGR